MTTTTSSIILRRRLALARPWSCNLLRKKNRMNIRKDTSWRNGDTAQQFVQFFIILNGQRQVTRHDAALLIVAGRISGQFQNFGAQVFQHGGQVDGRSGSHAGGVLALSQVAANAADRELEARLAGGGGGCLLVAAATALSFAWKKVWWAMSWWINVNVNVNVNTNMVHASCMHLTAAVDAESRIAYPGRLAIAHIHTEHTFAGHDGWWWNIMIDSTEASVVETNERNCVSSCQERDWETTRHTRLALYGSSLLAHTHDCRTMWWW